MKRTIKRMVEQEVEVCDRCEIREAQYSYNFRAAKIRVDAAPSGEYQTFVYCVQCQRIIDGARTLTRRKRTPAES